MREKETQKRIGSGVALFGGIMIAALAFSAGALGAKSHRPVEARAVRTETISPAVGNSVTEPRWISPADQDSRERKVPGHSELDLQLD